MNSDPHDSATWRTLGILDADEAAAFDEAMRSDPELRNAYREIESISAAIATVSTTPVKPRAGQLEQLHLRLGLNTPKRTNWAAISGWGAAAVLTFFLGFNQATFHKEQTVVKTTPQTLKSLPGAITKADRARNERGKATAHDEAIPEPIADDGALSSTQEEEVMVAETVEDKRLIQEIDVLRGQLKSLELRDKKRLEPVPGLAWPVIVRMSPPGSTPGPIASLTVPGEEPPITAILGDALGGNDALASNDQGTSDRLVSKDGRMPTGPTIVTTAGLGTGGIDKGGAKTAELPIAEVQPSAMPIYDAARDKGTFFVSNLPATGEQESYNLWVQNEPGGKPVYVGRLPKSGFHAADSYDFSLGSVGVLPTGFILTRDPDQAASLSPSDANTVLQGPR